jgi:TPR repeat protein
MDARAGIRACKTALAAHPQSARLQFQLARALIRAKRRDEGLPYLFEAAAKNYVAAFAIIGGTYQYDLGNVSEALKWYRRGVALNDVSAQTHLGDMYLDGIGVERDLAKALELFQPSAEQGYPLSQYKIGFIHQRGDRRVRRDMALAVAWFNKAAANGFARAQNDLGYLYETGDGVPRNDAQAAGWYRLAAEQGWALAQVNLAALYERGAGVRKDYKLAFYWSRLASDARLDSVRDTARQNVSRFKNRISPAQTAEVDDLVAAWRIRSPEESADAVKISGLVPLPAPAQPFAAAGQGADHDYNPSAIDADSAYQPPAARSATEAGKLANIIPAYGQYQALANVNVRDAPTTEARKIGRLG